MDILKELLSRMRRNLIAIERKLLRSMGIMTTSEFNALKTKLTTKSAEDRRIIASLTTANEDLKERLSKLPYDFDGLLEYYNMNQVNALVYKIINNTRNDDENVHYLKRWLQRIEDARNSLKPSLLEEK